MGTLPSTSHRSHIKPPKFKLKHDSSSLNTADPPRKILFFRFRIWPLVSMGDGSPKTKKHQFLDPSASRSNTATNQPTNLPKYQRTNLLTYQPTDLLTFKPTNTPSRAAASSGWGPPRTLSPTPACLHCSADTARSGWRRGTMTPASI